MQSQVPDNQTIVITNHFRFPCRNEKNVHKFRSTWRHLQTEFFNTSTLLANKEKELLKGNSKKQIKRHCHLTGYLHAQRPLGLRQHEKCTGVIEIWLNILVK